MSVSSKEGKAWSMKWIKENKHKIKRVLDVGAGAGLYPKYIKHKHKMLTDAEWIGVEIWEPFIEKYNLNNLYNKVINTDIREFNFEEHGEFDLCIFGDVLEHMTKTECIRVVTKALDHCKRILISIPIVHYPQGMSEENPYEAHIKDDWSDQEVKETFSNILDSAQDKIIGVYILGKKDF